MKTAMFFENRQTKLSSRSRQWSAWEEGLDGYPFGMQMPARSTNTESYRYSFGGHEKIDENSGNGNTVDMGDRWLDVRLGRTHKLDAKATKYLSLSPYSYVANNPIIFIDPDGKDIVVAFTGGPTGGGSTLKLEDAGTTGALVLAAQEEAIARGIKFDGTVIAPGWTAGSSVTNGYNFIKANYTEGETVILYGYSYGGDFAVELAEKLKGDGIKVQLLITVDASDGPLGNITVNTTIPDNVKVNRNIYQTDDSGAPFLSHKFSEEPSSDGTSGGTTDLPSSNGGSNTAADPSKTKVSNYNVTGKGVTHGNIDEKNLQNNIQSVKNFMSTAPTPTQQENTNP